MKRLLISAAVVAALGAGAATSGEPCAALRARNEGVSWAALLPLLLRRVPMNERNHRDGPQVTIRDLVLGAELAAATKDRANYLELRANAQFTVPEDRLVESVQEVLARHV